MGIFTPNVKASEWDKKTNIAINQAIEVEGTVLPAGSYVLKLAGLTDRHVVQIINQAIEVEGTVLPAGSYVLKLAGLTDRHVVQIFNADENHLFATVFAIPAERYVPADDSEFKFYESEGDEPPALHTWFYPGDLTGFEFRDIHRAPAVEAARSRNPSTSSSSSN
jgi:hypothetical protein